MRICFVTDLHGDLGHYAQLTGLLTAEKPELLLLGGDMHVDADREDPLGTQVAFVEGPLASLIDAWKSTLPGLEVAGVLGNHDLACTQAAVQAQHDAGRFVLLDHRRAWQHAGLSLLGLGITPPTPYWAKDLERLDRPDDPLPEMGGAVWDDAAQALREVEPEEHFGRWPSLADELDAMPVVNGPWIFVCHAPPYDSKLDRLPHLDYPIGSRAVREFVERRRPLCVLHGHVHESPEVTGAYADQVGAALCINPGQSHDRLHAVMFDTADVLGTLRHTVFG